MGERPMPHGASRWLASLLLCSVLATSARAEPLRLTLEQCLTRALESNPDLVEARWDEALAQGRVDEADAGQYPIANVTSISGAVFEAHGQVYQRPDESQGVSTVDTKGNLGPFTRVEVEFVQPVFTWGKISAGQTAARKGLEQETAKTAQRRAEVIYDVKKLYYNSLLARQVVELLGEVRNNFEKAISLSQERLDKGESSVTQADVLKLKVGFSGIAREVSKSKNGADLARDGLARAIGLQPDEEFEIAATTLEPLNANLKEMDQYIEQVFQLSPEWQQLLAGLAARQAQVEVEEADYYPSVFLAGGFKYGYAPNRDRQLSPFAKDDFNYLQLPGAAVGLRWPLSFMQTRAKVEQARAELQKLRAQKQSATTGLTLAVKKAYLDAVQSRESMDLANNGRKSARGLLVTALSSFELGIGNAQDLFEDLIVYTTSTSSFYEAVNDYNLALAKLSQTVGQEVADLKY